MLAADFFLAGMGAAALVLAAIADLSGALPVSLATRLLAPVLIACGAGLLVFELGHPFQGWRVFLNPKAILTFGAWNMTFAICLGGVNALGYIPWVAQRVSVLTDPSLRTALSVLLLLTGSIVASYPGVLLARHNSRPLWAGPGIAVLFIVSSFLTGTALHMAANFFFHVNRADGLRWVELGLAAAQTILWPVYLYVKISGTTTHEAASARKWASGPFAVSFWLGLFGGGSLLPMLLLLFAPQLALVSALLAMVGGWLLRHMVVHSGQDRTWIEGEERYLSRLPKGDELFMSVLPNSVRKSKT